MRPTTIRRHLKVLREECIDGEQDVVIARVAYAMSEAIRRVTEDVHGWGDLPTMAREEAAILRDELSKEHQ